MTYWLITFGVIVLIQFAWHLAREYERQKAAAESKPVFRIDGTALKEARMRELIGRIHSLEAKRDRNRVGSREYEALDLEAYAARLDLALLADLREHAD